MTLRNTLSSIAWLGLMVAVLFGPAATLDWPAAWVFLGEFIVGGAAMLGWLARRDPALLKERMTGPYQKGQAAADKIFLTVFLFLWYAWLALMALDAKRWHVSHMPILLNVIGALLIPAGFLFIARVFEENSFAAPVVRIQNERCQRVIDTGPYAVIRHPMYTGALFYLLGMPLLLSSWIGLCTLPLLVIGLTIRIRVEEATLREGLVGYANYVERVRYRLVPGIW